MKTFLILVLSIAMCNLMGDNKDLIKLVTNDAEVKVLETDGTKKKVQITQWVDTAVNKIDTLIKPNKAKFEVVGEDYGRSVRPYRKHIRKYFSFKNTSDKVISGIIFSVKFKNSFGDVVVNIACQTETNVKPGKSSSKMMHWYDEEGSAHYNQLITMVNLGKAKYTITVDKVAFEDGTIVSRK